MGTRKEPTVLRLVIVWLVVGGLLAVFSRAFEVQTTWLDAVAASAAVTLVIGTLAGWDLYTRRAQRAQARVAGLFLLGGPALTFAVELVLGAGATSAAVLTGIFVSCFAIFVAWDFRPSARRAPAQG